MPNCDRDHSNIDPEVFADLLNSQAGPGRHKCAACAYERGYQDALEDAARDMRRRMEARPPEPR